MFPITRPDSTKSLKIKWYDWMNLVPSVLSFCPSRAKHYERCGGAAVSHNLKWRPRRKMLSVSLNQFQCSEKLPPCVRSESTSTSREWMRRFLETGSLLQTNRAWCPSVSKESVRSVQQGYLHSPKMSIHRASRQLNLHTTRMHWGLHNYLKFYLYKVQIVQRMAIQYVQISLVAFWIQHFPWSDTVFGRSNFMPIDKSVITTCEFWESEDPRAHSHAHDQISNSPKINAWRGLTQNRIISPFFLVTETTNGQVDLEMIEFCVAPQVK
jgi:hypothetical protein